MSFAVDTNILLRSIDDGQVAQSVAQWVIVHTAVSPQTILNDELRNK